MGELHLEIARDRLVNDFKAKASMGRIEIGYRECALSQSIPVTKIFDKEIVGRRGKAGCTAIVKPFDPEEIECDHPEDVMHSEIRDGNQVIIRAPGLHITREEKGVEESSALPSQLDVNTVRTSLHNGSLAALARGPQFTFPMHNTRVILTFDAVEHIFGSETSASAISAAARLATQAALRDLVATSPSNGTALMEPVMNVIINVDEASLGAVVHDISSARGGHIVSLDDEVDEVPTGKVYVHEEVDIDVSTIYAPPDPFESSNVGAVTMAASANQPRTIMAKVPLKEMVGYLKHLRSLTAGRGTFVMHVDRFERMAPPRQKAFLANLNSM
jgi:elongation factor G